MKDIDFCESFHGFTQRPARPEDAAAYFEQNFAPLDPEVARLTGCKSVFSRREVTDFFLNALESEDCCLFLITDPEGGIIGESVINEIDRDLRCANFRIAFFHSERCGGGLGTWATCATRDFAFEQLGLHRLALDVFSFNPRAERVYEKAGFHREGVLRDAVLSNGSYADDILMAILEDEWREIKKKEL